MKKNTHRFSFKSRLLSFSYAFSGLATAFRQEHNLWIQGSAAVTAVALGFIFRIRTTEWIAIVIVISGVLVSELFNSAIESLVDHFSPEFDNKAGKVKDMAAGAVLISALGALVTGLIIFIPKIVAVL
jgi:diacylglycerol kinase